MRRLCSDDTDFNNKCEEMCHFFKKRGYSDSAVTTGKHRAQEIDRDTALQTSQNEETHRIPFTLTYHPQNLAIKNVILKNLKILRDDPETKHIFSLPPIISFKRDKNLMGCRKKRLPRFTVKAIDSGSMRNFNLNAFLNDLSITPWDSAFVFDDINDVWAHWSSLYNETIEKHAPKIRKAFRPKQLPWINNQLKKKYD